MISYSTNMMGPISLDWFRQRGFTQSVTRWSSILQKEITIEDVTEYWAGGRIDVYGTDDPYGQEIGLPIMHMSDWSRFSAWLDNYKTESVETLDKILKSYYNDGNSEIRWWKDEQVKDN